MAETGREFRDASGGRWRAAYTDAGVQGLVTMTQVAFTPLDAVPGALTRYLTVHPGYLERADDQQLQVALSQAQPVEPPW